MQKWIFCNLLFNNETNDEQSTLSSKRGVSTAGDGEQKQQSAGAEGAMAKMMTSDLSVASSAIEN